MELLQLNTLLLIPTIAGLICLTKFLIHFSIWIWITFLRPPKNLKSYGSWALVTGSTDGIGKALAFELAASNGLNIVLVGRNPTKLATTAKEITERHENVSIKTVVVDFAKCKGEEIARIIEGETKELDVGIVINNVGLAYPYAKYLHEVDSELMEGVVRVNVEGMTWVTRAVVPGMLKKGKGAIVNIGSGSANCVSSYPLYTIYAATKAYVAMFSRSMSVEYKHQGIDVQCQIPLLVATKMASIKKASLLIPSAETYSKASLRWIGHNAICLPYWPHALQALAMCCLPEPLLDWCLLQYMLGMRARGMRKFSKTENHPKTT